MKTERYVTRGLKVTDTLMPAMERTINKITLIRPWISLTHKQTNL